MRLNPVNTYCNSYINKAQPSKQTNPISFQSANIKPLTHTNIGEAALGMIGHVRLKLKSTGEEVFAEVHKSFSTITGFETYELVRNKKTIGKMNMSCIKNHSDNSKGYADVDLLQNHTSPHFHAMTLSRRIDSKLENLHDFSNGSINADLLQNNISPHLKEQYITSLNEDEYKGVGTRLLQIAQRRSDEANCYGNIQLKSLPEAIKFYTELGFRTKLGGNFDDFHLPAEAKEPLSKLYGGL
ncbi:MAG: GNAT family N-acetyltransferase [Candidatus Gastranaerophilales bacterium]